PGPVRAWPVPGGRVPRPGPGRRVKTRRASWPTWALRQIRYQLLIFWRISIALFFTILLQLIMLVLFGALYGDTTIDAGDGQWNLSQFYVGGLGAFTAVSATYTNLATMVPIRRDEGILKRWRGTPLPPSAYMAGFVGSSLVLALVGTAIMFGV